MSTLLDKLPVFPYTTNIYDKTQFKFQFLTSRIILIVLLAKVYDKTGPTCSHKSRFLAYYFYKTDLFENLGQIFIHAANWLDIVFLYENVQHVRTYERRQRRPEFHVFNTQIQKT